eukprot:4785057-Prymnesium_polylepis.1
MANPATPETVRLDLRGETRGLPYSLLLAYLLLLTRVGQQRANRNISAKNSKMDQTKMSRKSGAESSEKESKTRTTTLAKLLYGQEVALF